MQDDDWITETGMKLLMNETYVSMKPIIQNRASYTQSNDGEEIGHINFFRANRSKLWSIVFDWFSVVLEHEKSHYPYHKFCKRKTRQVRSRTRIWFHIERVWKLS